MIRHSLCHRSLTLFAAALFALPILPASNAFAGENEAVSADIATMFRAARGVISKNQGHINDASVGDKGLSGSAVVEAAKANYEAATGSAYPAADPASLHGQAQTALITAIEQVMADAQPLINEQGAGFKGFLPAIFARQVATQFSKNMSGSMSIKLTAPKSYVRNRQNRPDKWEASIIEGKFKSASWEKGKTWSETTDHKGKPAFRFILPEYYGDGCLKCHGEPKGSADITGGAKEGGKLGELGGAISVVIIQ